MKNTFKGSNLLPNYLFFSCCFHSCCASIFWKAKEKSVIMNGVSFWLAEWAWTTHIPTLLRGYRRGPGTSYAGWMTYLRKLHSSFPFTTCSSLVSFAAARTEVTQCSPAPTRVSIAWLRSERLLRRLTVTQASQNYFFFVKTPLFCFLFYSDHWSLFTVFCFLISVFYIPFSSSTLWFRFLLSSFCFRVSFFLFLYTSHRQLAKSTQSNLDPPSLVCFCTHSLLSARVLCPAGLRDSDKSFQSIWKDGKRFTIVT